MFWHKEEQTLWIPNAGALSIFNPFTETFTHCLPIEGDSASFPQEGANSILYDRQGQIWIGTGVGVVRFTGDKNHRTFETIRSDKLGKILFQGIHGLKQDIYNDSILWMGTQRSGLIKFNKYSYEAKLYHKETKGMLDLVRYVIPHPNGFLYLKSWAKGRVIFDPEKEIVIEDFAHREFHESPFRNQSIRLIPSERNEERIWYNRPHGQGLYVMNPADFSFQFIRKKTGMGGKDLSIRPLFIEENRTIWFGTDEGVFKEHVNPLFVENFFYDLPHNWQSSKNYIYKVPICKGSFHPWSNQIVLPIMDEKGLYVFNLTTYQLGYFAYPYAAQEEVFHVKALEMMKENLGLATVNEKLFRIDFNQQRLQEIKLPVRSRFVHQDRNGVVWLLTEDNTLFTIDLSTEKLKKVNLGKGEKLPELSKRLFSDKAGNIWIDYHLDKLGVYLPQHKDYYLIEGKENSYFRPAGFSEDKTGRIYTNNYHSKGSNFGYLDPHNPENGIHLVEWMKDITISLSNKDIEFDHRGRLWTTTSAGLEVVDFEKKTCLLLNNSNGVITWDGFTHGNPCQASFLTKLGDERMAIIYPGGIGLFHPDSLLKSREENLTLPKPYLSVVNVGGHPLKMDTAIVFKKHLVLPYLQNNISFSYSAIDHSDYYILNFMHQLVGVDEDWIPSKNHYASYSNLQPGQFSFNVKVQRGNELPAEFLTFTFTILPPWYRTWWAWCLWIFIVLSTLYAIYNFQVARHLAQAEAQHFKELDAVKNHMYTNITHEFRTPLTIILGMADQIKRDPKNWLKEGVRLIRRNGQHLLELINQMLELSKIESGHMPLNMIQGDVISYLHYLSESLHSYADSKDIRLHFLSDIAELPMDYDPEKLQQIIINLLSNAIKFTPSGGDVYLQTSLTDGLEKQLMIIVKDTGSGISKEHLPYVFDRFYQINAGDREVGEGSGIGLALTKELVKLMGGTIKVESSRNGQRIDSGTKFTIHLPIVRSAAFGEVSTVQLETPVLAGAVLTTMENKLDTEVYTKDRPMVLLIEDNQDVVTYLNSFLSSEYQIHIAINGAEGIEQAIELIPDLIVSDVMMPKKDGFEVCEALKSDERTSHIPIILLTAKTDHTAKLEGLSLGADAYLAKPFSREELLVRMEKLIEMRRSLQERFGKDRKLEKSQPSNPEELFIQKLISIIEDHLSDEHFGMPELCKQMVMSRTQLFRKLKALTGKSPTRFIRSIRLAKGRILLETTDMNVSEIAYQIGFGSAAYFSRMFGEEFGLPPSEVRE